jgi:tRNA U38,U39,U40 pseudouridine synthase TruA
MSKEELVQFALRHLPAAPPQKRPLEPPPAGAAEPSAKGKGDAASPGSQLPKKRRRKERPFEMSRYGQRMIALKFSYLGWHFHGLATQPHTESSVEDHLFSALLRSKLIESRSSCDYSRAGRTDVGVSAVGQVVGLRVRSNVVRPSTGSEELDYAKILNSSLPKQIRVLCWAPVSDGGGGADPVAPEAARDPAVRRPGQAFSARFDATHRSYKYFFTRGGLDIAAMREACGHFVGRHDFRNFCKMDVAKVKSFERVIYDVEVRRLEGDDAASDADADEGEFAHYYLFVRGQAFLWHQIRCMAAVLFVVGLGSERPSIVQRMLEDASSGTGHFSAGKPHYQMAPPTPLLLFDCAYPPSVVSFSVSAPPERRCTQTSFAYADAELAQMYGEVAAQASVVQAMLTWNDTVVCSGGRDVEAASRPFGALRGQRWLLPPHHGGKPAGGPCHIPFDKRKQESTVDEKRRRLVERRSDSLDWHSCAEEGTGANSGKPATSWTP